MLINGMYHCVGKYVPSPGVEVHVANRSIAQRNIAPLKASSAVVVDRAKNVDIDHVEGAEGGGGGSVVKGNDVVAMSARGQRRVAACFVGTHGRLCK